MNVTVNKGTQLKELQVKALNYIAKVVKDNAQNKN